MKTSSTRSSFPLSRVISTRAAASMLTASLAACVMGCGSATTAGGPPSTQPAAPSACSPKELASLSPERWKAARRQLAPPAANAIRLCRYSGLNAHPRLALLSSRLLTSRKLVGRLVSEFDRLPSLPGAVACPDDDGSQILARLAYPGGREVSITVGLSGCALVTNGSVHRSAAGYGGPPGSGPRLVGQLEQLLSGHERSPSISPTALAHGHWLVLARSPLGTRYAPTVVWDGHELLELGGTAGGPFGGPPSDGGAAYDPEAGRWRRVASAPAAVLPDIPASVWTGHQVFVFGGPRAAGLYDPASNRWTVTSQAPVGPFNAPVAVWTGRRVVLAGMTRGDPKLQIAGYDPAADTWTVLEPPISPAHRIASAITVVVAVRPRRLSRCRDRRWR